jgi:predicted phosphodiesterase
MMPAGRDLGRLGDTMARIDEPVLVCGHSHIPWAQWEAGQLDLNPGSVGAPVNGDVRA